MFRVSALFMVTLLLFSTIPVSLRSRIPGKHKQKPMQVLIYQKLIGSC